MAVEIVSAEPGARPGSDAAAVSTLEVAVPVRDAAGVLHIEVGAKERA